MYGVSVPTSLVDVIVHVRHSETSSSEGTGKAFLPVQYVK